MNRFKQLRFERGLTLREVAEGTGLSPSTVIRLERDQEPSAATVKALADFYDVTVTDLLGLDRSAA